MRRRKLLTIFLCLVPTFCSDVPEQRNDVPPFPADLASLCPYTSFCKVNATETVQPIDNKEPCCKPCSCESSCGLQYNCCYKHLDLYNREKTYQMVCKSMTATKRSTVELHLDSHYRMINKCIYSGQSSQVKSEPETDTSTFHPVYSAKKGFIYFNAAVAVCNKANDTVSFQKAFTCSSQEELLTDVDRYLQGFEPSSDCFVHFIPPDGVSLKYEQCEPNVVRKCNVTGEMEERNPFWEFCETFNATYMRQYGLKIYGYGNIYCHMCNNRIYRGKLHMCKTKGISGSNKIPGGSSLTVLLEPGSLSDDENTKIYRRSSGCLVNEIIVHSFSIRCRLVKCPVLKSLLNNECKFYSRRLIGGPFVVYLRLVPALENAKIPQSFFDEMPEKDKNDETAKWLKRKAMKHWNVYTFYHLSQDNVNIDFFVVKATYPLMSVNPKHIEETVDMALKDLWLITQINENVALRVQLNMYTAYDTFSKHNLMKETGIHVHDDRVYLPKVFEINYPPTETIRDELLYPVPKFSLKHFKHSEMILTKLFFCRQVDLLPEEYEDGIHSIFFKVRNVSLHTFIRVYTTAKVAKLHNPTAKRDTVRICLSEFPQAADAPNKESTFQVKIIALFITINVLVKMYNIEII